MADAHSATTKASVQVRSLNGRGECATGSALLARIWGTAPESAPFTGDALTSFEHAGACVLGAFDGAAMVGLTVGLAGAPGAERLYSMIAGVVPGHSGRGVGLALKLAQRAWALENGATTMVWTFDPLIRRNAHFNLNRLGARAGDFLPDFYPPMHDELNRADLTDRLVAVWDLVEPAVPSSPPAGAVIALECSTSLEPVRSDAGPHPWLVGTPPDIEAVRRRDPALARRWRISMREVMRSATESGRRITGLTDTGSYVLEQAS